MKDLLLAVMFSPFAMVMVTVLAYSAIWVLATQVAPRAGPVVRWIAWFFWQLRVFVVGLGISAVWAAYDASRARNPLNDLPDPLEAFLVSLVLPLGILALLFMPFGLRRVFPILSTPAADLEAWAHNDRSWVSYCRGLALMISFGAACGWGLYVILFDDTETYETGFALLCVSGLILAVLGIMWFVRGGFEGRRFVRSLFGAHQRLARDVAWWTVLITWLILLAWSIVIAEGAGEASTRDALELVFVLLLVFQPVLDAILLAVSRHVEGSIALFHKQLSEALLILLRVVVPFWGLIVAWSLSRHKEMETVPWRDLFQIAMLIVVHHRLEVQGRLQRRRWWPLVRPSGWRRRGSARRL